MARKQSYHTNLIVACKLGILEPKIKNKIPRSTFHYFKNRDLSHLLGYEFASAISDNISIIQELLKWKSLFHTLVAVIRIKNTIISLNNSALSKLDRMKNIISTINSVKTTIGLDRALALFKISRNQFYSWSFKVKHQCIDSFSGFCIKRWPNQISMRTINKMKNICSESFFNGWPLSSIAYYAKRQNTLNLSLSTWYKYAKALGISRHVRKCNKKRRIGIRASEVNQIWHADVTQVNMLNNSKAYVAIVMDNFSRKILACNVSLRNTAENMLETLQKAYNRYCLNPSYSTDLIVDGGSESNNVLVESFLAEENVPIRKIIAQKDIVFSNSMIEAVNKLLKYRYLFNHEIRDINHLNKHLNYFIPIYNSARPHISLKGLTPDEVFYSIISDKTELGTLARGSRMSMISENRNYECSVCSD